MNLFVQTIRSRHAARGVTVLELLIVMTILLMITAATIPIMMPAMANRRLRESSRLVSAFISGARSRAIETGRPVGVVFERFNGLPLAYTMHYVEVPEPYAGESASSACIVTQGMMGLTANMGWIDAFNPTMVRVGDEIQFNYQGQRYRIDGPDTMPTDGIIDTPMSMMPTVLNLSLLTVAGRTPWTATPSPRLPYQIIRQPQASAIAPLTLPEGICVDLYASGITNGGTFTGLDPTQGIMPMMGIPTPDDWTTNAPLTYDPTVMFGPNGAVLSVTNGSGALTRPNGAAYFLIGRRELMADVSKKTMTVEKVDENIHDQQALLMQPSNPLPTLAYLQNFWVTVSPQSGHVSVSEMATNPQTMGNAPTVSDARRFAIDGRMVTGGR